MNKLGFAQFDYLPPGLLETDHKNLHTILPSPTLIHLPGKQTAPLFISVLLHGNEPTGFIAVQLLLKKYCNKPLPRALSLFLGNVGAASQDLRRFEDQPDFNRIWPGTEISDCPETAMALAIVDIMKARQVFASIDIHNNTGINPHYACINKLDNANLHLAALFNRLVVYFIRPKGVQSAAFAELCPSVTLECGRPGQQNGVEHALEFLDSCLHLFDFPQQSILPQDIDLFHTVAQVKIDDSSNFSFSQTDTDLLLNQDLDHLNFTEVAQGTVFGLVKNNVMPVIAKDENGHIVTSDFFSIQNGLLQLTKSTMPSMLTLDECVIRQDCLCYLMERMTL